MKNKDKTQNLGQEPIMKLLMQFSIPAIIAMVINAIYNIVDRIFIGQYVGEEALAGLTIAFPLMMMVFAVATMIGQGGGNLISIRLGEKDNRKADHVFSNTIVLAVILGIIIIPIIYLNLESLLALMGGEGEVLTYSINYMRIILIGFIFQIVSFSLNSIVRAEGFPVLSMTSMLVSGLTNMILDYIFIVHLGMGVEGAALATIIGQLCGMVILISHFVTKKSSLSVHLKDLIPDLEVVGKIISVGAATFVTTLGNSVSMMVLNGALGRYGGTAAITSMGAINSLFTLVIMPLMGIQGGVQPIIGYNYGAKAYGRVREALLKAFLIGIGFSTLIFAVLQIFPAAFIAMFLDPSSPTIPVAMQGLRIYTAMLPILSINIFGAAFFQAIADSRKALFMGAMRQFIFLLPLLFIIPQFFGLTGVWLATPAADLLAVIVTVLFLIPKLRSLREDDSTGALQMAV